MSIAILLRLNRFILGFLLVSTSSSVYCFNVSSEILKQGSAARESFLEQLQDFKETKIESKQKEAEKIEIEQREQELEEKSSVEAKSEISREPAREPVVSLEEQAEKQVVKQTAKHEEAPGIRV